MTRSNRSGFTNFQIFSIIADFCVLTALLSAFLIFSHHLRHEIAYLFGSTFQHLPPDVGVGTEGNSCIKVTEHTSYGFHMLIPRLQPSSKRVLVCATYIYPRHSLVFLPCLCLLRLGSTSNYHRTGTKSTDFFARSEYFSTASHTSESPILCLLRRSFCIPVVALRKIISNFVLAFSNC